MKRARVHVATWLPKCLMKRWTVRTLSPTVRPTCTRLRWFSGKLPGAVNSTVSVIPCCVLQTFIVIMWSQTQQGMVIVATILDKISCWCLKEAFVWDHYGISDRWCIPTSVKFAVSDFAVAIWFMNQNKICQRRTHYWTVRKQNFP